MTILTALPWAIIVGLGLGFWIKNIIERNKDDKDKEK